MKKIVLKLLNFVAKARIALTGPIVRIGADSRAYIWRISGPRGARFLLGNQSMVLATIALERSEATVEIGDRTFIGGGGLFSVASKITIGSDVMIAWGCTITDHDSHALKFEHRANDVIDYLHGKKDWSHVPMRPILVESKAWIGFNCSILKGVTIGTGAVVAANSNVTKDVPPWTLVAGNPARVIRDLPQE